VIGCTASACGAAGADNVGTSRCLPMGCGGRRRILAEVTEPTAVVAMLEHLGLPARAPPLAAAREPGPFDAA
jgi:hypothetical protein